MISPFRYPGGKSKLLPQILPFIDKSISKTKTFCDVFVGGGSILLAVAEKYPDIQLFCNDKDEFVYCFWKLLADNNDNDINQLKEYITQKPTIDLYYQLRETEPKNVIESAYRAIFFNRTSFSGDMRRAASPIGGKKQISKYTVDCRYNAFKINQKIDKIKQLLANRTSVFNIDINSFQLLDDSNITIYLDPPYFKKGKMLYEKYMKNEEHISLANKLKDRQDWILSYDNCSEILEMYKWANVNFIDASYCIQGFKTNWNKTKEILILPA